MKRNMKNLNNIIYSGLMIFFLMGFFACDSEDYYDFPGDPYNRVYLPDRPNSYKIIQTPVGVVSNLKYEAVLKCTQKAEENIKTFVEIDNSLVAEYNEKHGTDYEAMPEAAILIENTVVTIPEGAMVSSDTLRVVLSNDESVVANLDKSKEYLIPLRLTKAEGGNSLPSTNMQSTFLIVSIIEDNINHEATESDITGTLVADQTGWSAVTNGELLDYYSPIEALFDGDMTSYCYITNPDEIQLDINMGKEYTFDAITLYYSYGWGGGYGSLLRGMTIYISPNGVDWTSIGEISVSSSKICVFYAPITTQYLRIVKPKEAYGTSLTAGVFNVYAK